MYHNIYFFSNTHLFATHNNQTYSINKNCTLKLTNVTNSDQIEICDFNFNKITICPNTASTCNFYKVLKLENSLFIEIVATSFENLTQKINTKNCEVFIYSNALRIINQKAKPAFNILNGFKSSITGSEVIPLYDTKMACTWLSSETFFNGLANYGFKLENILYDGRLRRKY